MEKRSPHTTVKINCRLTPIGRLYIWLLGLMGNQTLFWLFTGDKVDFIKINEIITIETKELNE